MTLKPDYANSKSVWNFADTVKQDKHHQNHAAERNENGYEGDEMQQEKKGKTIDERIKAILDDYGLVVSDAEQPQPQKAKEQKNNAKFKTDAKIHYDKEDLISFHQLFISKPLVKACFDLEYEHPTVI